VKTALTGLLAIFIFFALLNRLGLAAKAQKVLATAGQAWAVLTNPKLSDDAKELAMREQSKVLAILFLTITGGGLLALFIPFAILLILDAANLVSLSDMAVEMMSVRMIALGTVVPLLWFYFFGRSRNA
jgi:hypothetical protein